MQVLTDKSYWKFSKMLSLFFEVFEVELGEKSYFLVAAKWRANLLGQWSHDYWQGPWWESHCFSDCDLACFHRVTIEW